MAAGNTWRSIERRFGIDHEAVRRHALNHMSPSLVPLRYPGRRRTDLKSRVEALITRTERLLTYAEESRHLTAATGVVRELKGLLALYGQATGELRPDGSVTVVNVLSTPEWTTVRGRLLAAMAPYPEARAAVAQALMDGPTAPPRALQGLGSEVIDVKAG